MPRINVKLRQLRFGRRVVVVALALAAAVSCDWNTAGEPSQPVKRRYALTHFNGALLPAFHGVAGADSMWIAAETLTFRTSSEAMDSMRFVMGPTGASTSPHVFAGLQEYSVYGDSIQVGTLIMCIALPCPSTMRKGTISDMDMVLEHEAVDEYRYVRIPPP